MGAGRIPPPPPARAMAHKTVPTATADDTAT